MELLFLMWLHNKVIQPERDYYYEKDYGQPWSEIDKSVYSLYMRLFLWSTMPTVVVECSVNDSVM